MSDLVDLPRYLETRAFVGDMGRTPDPKCVLRRSAIAMREAAKRITTLEAQLSTEALRGAKAMQEAAARVVHGLKDKADDWADMVDAAMCISALDPAAVLRDKAL